MNREPLNRLELRYKENKFTVLSQETALAPGRHA